VPEPSLEPLITECPNCRTRFRVSETQLAAASGRVRCGACLSVFQGTDYLIFGTATSQQSDASPELDDLLDELNDATQPEPPRKAKTVIERASEAARGSNRRAAKTVPFPRAARAEPEAQSEPGKKIAPGKKIEPAQIAEPNETAELEPATAAQAKGDAEPVPTAAEIEIELAPPAVETEAPADALAHLADAELVDAAGEAPVENASLAAEPVNAPRAADSIAGAGRVDATPADPGDAKSANAIDVKPADARAPTRASEPRAAPEPRVAAAIARPMPIVAVDVEEARAPPRRSSVWQPILLVLLIATLAAQVLWLQFATWSLDPQIRPVYELGCRYLGCKLPVMRDLSAIHARNLVVRTHPDVAGALMVDALIVNEASFPQPFPLIEMRFSSMSGEVVAARRFASSEYLSGELKGAQSMQPRTPVHIALEIEDPGKDALNYVVLFR